MGERLPYMKSCFSTPDGCAAGPLPLVLCAHAGTWNMTTGLLSGFVWAHGPTSSFNEREPLTKTQSFDQAL